MLHLNLGENQQPQPRNPHSHTETLEKEDNTFLFWCFDTDCNEQYDPKATDITKVTDLYAQWTINNYTLTFEFGNNGGNPLSE